jgi:hypothetical protein
MVKFIIIDARNLTGDGMFLKGGTKANAALTGNLFDLTTELIESLIPPHETSIAEHPAFSSIGAILIDSSILMPLLSKS